jgi:hypothetical protein
MAQARFVVDWSEDELFSKSDLVVIATPVSNVDVKQHERFHGPQFRDVPVIGVFTTFAVNRDFPDGLLFMGSKGSMG